MFTFSRRWILLLSPFLLLMLFYRFSTPDNNTMALDTDEEFKHNEQGSIVLEGTQPLSDTGAKPKIKTKGKSKGKGKGKDKGSMDAMLEQEICVKVRRDMDDVFVVLKTGATEALEKIPIQLRTSLKCVPHLAIFSDYEEEIEGVRTHDVLSNVTEQTMRREPEFEVYHRLQQVGRAGLTAADFGDDANGPFGKVNNPGWKLDKWKFLPMIDAALERRPNAKWFVFLEADTYIVWQNLVNWLARLDHNQDYYIGSPMQIGETLFAYGGAGIVLSQKAMQRLHSHRIQNQEELEAMTAGEWAGDCALARALDEVHIPLTWAWPMMMTSRPWEVDHFSEGYGRQPWCYPVISYHHMSPQDLEEMWQFDRSWFRSGKNALMLHADVYREFIHNGSLAEREDWDNLSGGKVDFDPSTPPSIEACADTCKQTPQCLQFSFNQKDLVCKHASTTFAGVASIGTYSGWMPRRVQRLLNAFQSSCPQVEYIFD